MKKFFITSLIVLSSLSSQAESPTFKVQCFEKIANMQETHKNNSTAFMSLFILNNSLTIFNQTTDLTNKSKSLVVAQASYKTLAEELPVSDVLKLVQACSW